MAKQTPLSAELLTGICKVIADTTMGLSGKEIENLLTNSKIPDTDPGITKWQRLFNAFVHWQNRNQCSNNIFDFLLKAMSPVSYMNNHELFEWRRIELNKRLYFIGLEIAENGRIHKVVQVETIKQSEKRADKLRQKLSERDVHIDVIKFCKAELLEDNYFHAVFETTKSVADKIRTLSGETTDGNELIDTVFGINSPILIINSPYACLASKKGSGCVWC